MNVYRGILGSNLQSVTVHEHITQRFSAQDSNIALKIRFFTREPVFKMCCECA